MMFLFALFIFGLICFCGAFVFSNAFAIGGAEPGLAIFLGVVLTIAVIIAVLSKK